MTKTFEFKAYNKIMKEGIKKILKELKNEDTNFEDILTYLEVMEGRTKNFL